MARGNRSSAVRGSRSRVVHRSARQTAREVRLTIRDGMRVLRLTSWALSLVVRYREEGETECAFGDLRLATRSLSESVRELGLNEGATLEIVLDRVSGELFRMYDAETASRLIQALRECFNRRGLRQASV